jgi:glycosyltransferase involved in cell wall biosynthesis
MIRVAFIGTDFASGFVRADEGILNRHFRTRRVVWKGKRSIPALVLAVLRSDVTFSWFALDHAYAACRLARLFGKKSIVVVGGVDAANRPDLGYGAFLDPIVAKRTRYAVSHSDRVLVVEESLREELIRNSRVDRREIMTIHLGFDTERFTPGDGPRRNVLMVAAVQDTNVRRKSLDIFMDVARRTPDLPFVLVGARDNEATDRLRKSAPANVRFLGRLSDLELLDEYRAAKVYVQISRFEAFGYALGEAMACGCVPVGTDVGGIAALVDGAGFLVPVGDVDATIAAVRNASRGKDGTSARARIKEHFSLERREAALVQLINSLFEA